MTVSNTSSTKAHHAEAQDLSKCAFLTAAAKLRGEETEQALVLWKRKGKRVFDAEKSKND